MSAIRTHGGDESWRDMSYCFTENEAEDHVADSRLSMREAAIRILSRNAPSLGVFAANKNAAKRLSSHISRLSLVVTVGKRERERERERY
eukprot:1366831-Amorphochlora_amoeboformis.AAC.4